jgi:hypothetical protein
LSFVRGQERAIVFFPIASRIKKFSFRIFNSRQSLSAIKVVGQYGLVFSIKYEGLAAFCHPHPVFKYVYITDTTLQYSRRWAGEIRGGHIPRKQLRKREGPYITVFTVKEAHSAFPFSSPLPPEKH